MKTRFPEPHEEWDAYCRQEDEWAARREWPKCAVCSTEIMDEWHYLFWDEHVCADCIHDYVIERKVQTTPRERH